MTVPPIVYVCALSETTRVAPAVEGELDNSAEIAVVIVRNEIKSQPMATPNTKAALLIILAPRII
jgi:hypothetical protein